VKLYRAFARNAASKPAQADGPLWVPRDQQGDGRHDNPDAFGCLYVSDREISPIVEQLARFRGAVLTPALLIRRGLPLAIAELELSSESSLVDLDDPRVLIRHGLRPSRIATRQRSVTQPSARALYERHPAAVGLRWWSSFESLWMNVTLFDRAVKHLKIASVRLLTIDDPSVVEAAEFLGLIRNG
jgi:hypothetical protein